MSTSRSWRSPDSLSKRVEHDLDYIRNWALLLDLEIIFLTILSAAARRGAF